MRLRAVIAASFGNILEWYDFALFTAYASVFATLFFPEIDPYAGTLAVFGIFAAGFVCRPLGAIIFGHFGDRLGRIKTLRASVLCISVPTLLIGCLPTYDSIGLWAAVFLTILRLFQGICLGGEYAGIIIYLTEMAPDRRRGFFASFAGTGANIGILVATGMVGVLATFVSSADIQAWVWRMPFIFAGVLGLMVYFFRLGLAETQVFEGLAKKAEIVKIPFREVLIHAPWHVVRIVALVSAGSTFYYVCFVYLSSYLTQVSRLTQQHASQLQSFFILLMLLLVPLAGIVSDRVGRKRMFLWMLTLLMVSCIPGFYLLSTGYMPVILLTMTVFSLISSMEQGTTSATVVENFPARLRYTGIALGYNLGNALFGGTAPLILAFLLKTTGHPLTPAFYLMFMASITLIVVIFFLRETHHSSLDD